MIRNVAPPQAVAASADLLAQLKSGAPVEARVVAVEARLVKLLLDGLPLTAPPPEDVALTAGDRVALRLTTDAAGAPRIAMRRAADGRGVAPPLDEAATVRSAKSAAAVSPPASTNEPLDAEAARDILLPLARAALAGQRPIADLFARVAAALAAREAFVPAIRAPMADIAARALDPEMLTGESLRRAVATSGVFLEARLAAGDPPSGDLKASLMALRPLLAPEAETPRESSRPAAPPREAAPPAEPSRPPLRGEVRALDIAAMAPAEDAQDVNRSSDRPALLSGIDGALDRIRLMQFASLNDRAPAELQQQQPAPRQWQAEIPLALAGAFASLPLTIEHDRASARAGGDPDATWRMRFTLDTPELGAVDVVVGWRKGRVDIDLRAEREETAALLARGQDELSARLAGADVAVDAIRARAGRAARRVAPARPGQFWDSRS